MARVARWPIHGFGARRSHPLHQEASGHYGGKQNRKKVEEVLVEEEGKHVVEKVPNDRSIGW